MATVSRGIRAPIIRQGDDIVKITVDSVLKAAEQDGFALHNRDVIAVTEAVVARADGNYATVDDIAADVKAKLGHTEPQPFFHLPEGHSARREEDNRAAGLPLRRGGQSPC